MENNYLAPNGKQSNLTPVQYELVRTNEFKAWFGDWENDPKNASKVVDENGEPLVVFHATSNKFNVFDIISNKSSGIEIGSHFGSKSQAIFLANRDNKNSFLIESFLRIMNPLIVEDKGKWTKSIYKNILIKLGYNSNENWENTNTIIQSLLKIGIDGFEYENKYEGKGKSYIVIQPNQIKLADGTNTTFDSNNNDIRFDEGGKVEDLISQGVVELKMFDTKPEHAKEYGLDSVNPLYVQSLCITENQRLKGIGNKVLQYIDDYAIKNGHDLVFGHITQKAEFTKDNRETFFCDTDIIKNWLHSKGYAIQTHNNDFHKVINNNIPYNNGGLIAPNGKPRKDRLGDTIFEDIWLLTRNEYANESINVYSGDSLNRKKPQLQNYMQQNITNVQHKNRVQKAINENKYEYAIENGFITKERANEIIKSAELDIRYKKGGMTNKGRVYSSVMGGKASKIDSNELKMNLGGLVGNTYTEIMYRVILSTETTTDIYATSTDLDDITSDYNSISPSDFDNPNSNSNTKELQSITKEYQFIGGDDFEAQDYIEDLDNTDFWTLTNEDTNDIESESVADINKATDEMIDEIREFIKEEYNIGGRYAEKYMTISVDDEDGEFITDLNIRTGDHSQNTRNNDSNSFNLSFVIANLNATQNRFIPLGTEYYFDDNNDIEDIKEEIKGIIDDKIEEIKENREKFNTGGGVNNLSNKQKREIISINTRISSDGLPMDKLSADGNYVMELDIRTNRYKKYFYNEFYKWYERTLRHKRETDEMVNGNANAKKVFEYLDKNGAELLYKSIYGSRYYIYKGNHIRVSSHSNQSGITDAYGIPKYKPYEETHNIYSYEVGGWEEMISKIQKIKNRFVEGGGVGKINYADGRKFRIRVK